MKFFSLFFPLMRLKKFSFTKKWRFFEKFSHLAGARLPQARPSWCVAGSRFGAAQGARCPQRQAWCGFGRRAQEDGMCLALRVGMQETLWPKVMIHCLAKKFSIQGEIAGRRACRRVGGSSSGDGGQAFLLSCH
jgi:hypothetical protein